MDTFAESGMKMFAFTSKHHEGFSMFDTRTRVKSRANWTAAGGPKIESCDLAYSIMETPFRRDVVKELCDAAHKRDIKIDLYFSHPDWYDADFRPYVVHPLQVPSSRKLLAPVDWERTQRTYHGNPVIVPDPSDAEVARMMRRHRDQLTELLTNYGRIDMICLDMWLGAKVWPELRATVMKLRELQPDVMLRNRGIGNYGDYFTPERAIPESMVGSDKPWFCINPLGTDFSYDPNRCELQRHGLDCAHPGRHGCQRRRPDGGCGAQCARRVSSRSHPADEGSRRVAQGEWRGNLRDTRPRDGGRWAEGDKVRFTRSKDRRFVFAILTEWPGTELALKSVRPKEDRA
jgi:alpha-L-fucosidase